MSNAGDGVALCARRGRAARRRHQRTMSVAASSVDHAGIELLLAVDPCARDYAVLGSGRA
jgi:hypothetical protein